MTPQPPPIKRLSHICLSTANLPRLTEFYCNVLGCRLVHEYKNAGGETYGVFLLAGSNTFLEFFNSAAPLDGPSRFRHLCFEVSDVNPWVEYLTGQGHTIEVRRGRTDGVLQFWINDPDGNQVEFHQYDQGCVQFRFLT